MTGNVWLWGGFLAFILAMLAIDLGLVRREVRAVTTKEAAIWTAVWVSLAVAFNVGLYLWRGAAPALEFLTGYIIEYSLSVDNIFVFIMLFAYFAVPAAYRHRVLFWGILGALIMRGALIGVGAALIARFHWILYLFGAFLIVTGFKMAFAKEEGVEPDKNPVVRLCRRYVPVTDRFHGEAFFVRQAGRWFATPLFIVLLVVETTDVMFALDSIPAIFAVTRDPFIVFTSNTFAILGLRSLYFLLDSVMGLFRYLKVGLSIVLVFIGVKMVVADWFHVPIALSLGVVAGIIALSIAASLIIRPAAGEELAAASEPEGGE